MDRDRMVQYLEGLLEECKNYYPDDDSQQKGYQAAVEEILAHIAGSP